MKWRKSSYSNGENTTCVEVARTEQQDIATRDSKHPAGPQLRFSRHEWAVLLDGIKSGKYEL
jgi:hypothetical protein